MRRKLINLKNANIILENDEKFSLDGYFYDVLNNSLGTFDKDFRDKEDARALSACYDEFFEPLCDSIRDEKGIEPVSLDIPIADLKICERFEDAVKEL